LQSEFRNPAELDGHLGLDNSGVENESTRKR